jgi:hypothetical protein
MSAVLYILVSGGGVASVIIWVSFACSNILVLKGVQYNANTQTDMLPFNIINCTLTVHMIRYFN